jgi:hypothetical protein
MEEEAAAGRKKREQDIYSNSEKYWSNRLGRDTFTDDEIENIVLWEIAAEHWSGYLSNDLRWMTKNATLRKNGEEVRLLRYKRTITVNRRVFHLSPFSLQIQNRCGRSSAATMPIIRSVPGRWKGSKSVPQHHTLTTSESRSTNMKGMRRPTANVVPCPKPSALLTPRASFARRLPSFWLRYARSRQ